ERSKPGNLFFSPYSVSTALAMTYAGARGDTAAEMAKVLHFPAEQAEAPRAFAQIAHRIEEISRSNLVTLTIANSLWCQRNYQFTETFLAVNRDYYHATTRLVDFIANSEAARQEINSWVATSTRDKIRDLLQSGQLSRDTVMVLCNAVYFK